MEYALLLAPGASRIYYEAAQGLFRRELELMLQPWNITNLEGVQIGGREYLCFSAEVFPKEAMQAAARNSAFFALFQRKGELLYPLDADSGRVFSDSLPAMLKYNGKTNEQFTRLLVNLACCAMKVAVLEPVLMDPLCGRETTLFEAMTLGLSVVGIEQNQTALQSGETFLLRYLKEGHYKHETEHSRPRDRQGRQRELLTIRTATEKEAWKRGTRQVIRFFHGDTTQLEGIIATGSVHMLVADLPYGVQHGSHQGRERSRSAAGLFHQALPGWNRTLCPGAGGAVAFNEYTTSWEALAADLEKNGFTVLSSPECWRHRVAEAIDRNLIVFRKEEKE